ncbi:aspartate kinase [Tenacibaculum ovolyticum]|uniref:aspartate kinase n=1 Tax=Tenacibaculum ovolyticum TaxID=104270 RepID=UPI0003FA21EC|nr:aspartate kinase [Tenacibaculum ovolyticum]
MEVLKFGGSSVSSKTSLENMLQIIKEYNSNETPLIIVVSALKGITNNLVRVTDLLKVQDEEYRKVLKLISDEHIEFINYIFQEVPKGLLKIIKRLEKDLIQISSLIIKKGNLIGKDYDKIVSFGELFSAHIIATYLKGNQMSFSFKDARELIITNNNFTNAKIDWDLTKSIMHSFFYENKKSYVVTGFIARSIYGDTTTLGRGGSDYTATVLGTILNAKKVTKWTDVNGIMTADPNTVMKASSLDNITYDELKNLTKFGSNVLVHPNSINELSKHNIPFLIRNTFNFNFKGTQVINHENTLQRVLSVHQSCSIVAFEKKTDLSKNLIKEVIDKDYLFFRIKKTNNQNKSFYIVANDCINFFSLNLKGSQESIILFSDLKNIEIVDRNIDLITITSKKMDKKLELENIKNLLVEHNINILGFRFFNNSISLIFNKTDFKKALVLLHEELTSSFLKVENNFI